MVPASVNDTLKEFSFDVIPSDHTAQDSLALLRDHLSIFVTTTYNNFMDIITC